jgi:hypothetical protein
VFALAVSGTQNDASAKSMTFTKVDQSDYVSYEVADLGTMFNLVDVVSGTVKNDAGDKYDKTVKVYGVKADGTKVLLPASAYTVTTDGELLVDTTTNVIGDLTASVGYVDTDFTPTTTNVYADVEVSVLVTVKDGSTGSAAAVIEKTLLVSNKASKVETIVVDEDVVTDGKASITSAVVSNAELNLAILKVKDQYGVAKVEKPVVTITNLVKVDDSKLAVVENGLDSANITGATMGDKFTASYKYASGVKVAVDYTVGLDTVTAPAANAVLDRDALVVTYAGVAGTLNLPITATNGSTITWAEKTDAANVAVVTGNTVAITRDTNNDVNDTVTFTATVVNGSTTLTKDFDITVLEAKVPTAPVTTGTKATLATSAADNMIITFDEAIDATSMTAVETAIKGGIAGAAGTDLEFAWTVGDTVVTVVNNNTTTAATFASDVTANVTDLIGNTATGISIDIN